MFFKLQLPGPAPQTPVLVVGAAPSTGSSSSTTLVVAKSSPCRLHVFRWNRMLGVVEAPAEVESCALMAAGTVLLVGCAASGGSIYRVADLEARLLGSRGPLRLGDGERCFQLPPDGGGTIDQLVVTTVHDGGEGPLREQVLAKVRGGKGEAAVSLHLVPAAHGKDRAGNKENASPCPGRLVGLPPCRVMECFSFSGTATCVLHGRDGEGPSSSSCRLFCTPLSPSSTEERDELLLHTLATPVVALLAVDKDGERVLVVETSGQLSLLPPPGANARGRATQTSTRLQQSLQGASVRTAVQVGELVACLSDHGAVWLAHLVGLFEEAGDDRGARWTRLDCAADVVALASSPHALFVLTRRGRVLCFQDVLGSPLPCGPPPPSPPLTSSGGDETEALLSQMEEACQRTEKVQQQLAETDEALAWLRSAWAVVAGKGLLVASLDVAPRPCATAAPSPRLGVRLQNPTDSETLPLQGWSLMVRIESAAAAVADGPAGHLLAALSPPLASVLAGASWGLDDLGPGEVFQADLPLPITGSPLPVTARLSLCCPFMAAAGEPQGSPGVCLELGSRPLDILDLALPPKRVPTTPTEMRALDATAAKQSRSLSWECNLAKLLFGGLRGREEPPQRGGTAANEGGATGPLPQPLLSSTLRILWPVVEANDEEEAASMDVAPGPAAPALADLLGACDGAKVVPEGMALQAPGGRLLLARLLAGSTRILMDDTAAMPATGLQLSLSAMDQGVLSLMRAACCQRLGPGASVRTRRLPLTDSRMKCLETAHHEVTALAAEVQQQPQQQQQHSEEEALRQNLQLAERVVALTVALGQEVDQAFLLDLTSGGDSEGEDVDQDADLGVY